MITVAICTYNHAETLAITLESLRTLYCPPDVDYEILVVNNNSSDNTAEVVSNYAGILAPRLRSVFETRQGLSHARNRALREAYGEIVSFIDDDVKVDRFWLEAVANAFTKYSATVVGGCSYLIFPTARPVWLSAEMEISLSRLDYGEHPIVDTDKNLFGLNFSVLRQAALEVGGFDTNLGRRGKSLATGEEADLLIRIRRRGGIVVYEPKAIVGHIVSVERLSKQWFLRRSFSGAMSAERLRISNGEPPNLTRALGGMFKSFVNMAKATFGGYTTEGELFSKQVSVAGNLGRLVESIRQKFRRKS